jgi:rare lipoprotein A
MASLNLRGGLIICCMMGQLLSPIHTLTLQAEESGTVSTPSAPVAAQATEAKGVEGLASYYATRYNNRRTNSGQRYDPAKLTAAHPTLPHGTRVKVVNLTNNKEVIVTINDRCKPHAGPFIDLSRAAAKQLGFLGKGKTRVRIIPFDEDEEET